MSEETLYRLRLHPTGAELIVPVGTPFHDLLFEQGVEFPCGGQGRCRGCKVRVRAGNVAVNAAQRERLSPQERAVGWRLACQSTVQSDVTLELRQWDTAILGNDTVFAFTPCPGYGIAVDVGTTTLAAQLLDRQTGQLLGVKTALNPQAKYGADIMSRIEFALGSDGEGGAVLTRLIREEIGRLIHRLLVGAHLPATELRRVVLVGNTVMHHLFCGIDLEPLSHVPFEPVEEGRIVLAPEAVGWEMAPEGTVEFLPCLGGFVGSDILAGILATGLADSSQVVGLIDLGTNGEMVFGNRDGLLCAATAAGPAFEGARIAMGMRAATGAIYKVEACGDALHAETLGGGAATGICGSGLVDAAAAALTTHRMKSGGRLIGGDILPLADSVHLTQTDIRQLQLAKGAIAAGVRILLRRLELPLEAVTAVYLAGAFGNYVRLTSAARIGLLPFAMERVHPVGNTALLGAKMALFADGFGQREYHALRAKTRHFTLHEDPRFQDTYVEEMGFPVG